MKPTICILAAAIAVGCSVQEKKFEREYTFSGGRMDNQQAAHSVAAAQVRTMLLSDVVHFLHPNLRNDSTDYAERVEAATAGIVGMQVEEEKWDASTKRLHVRAKMMVDSDIVKPRIVETLGDEHKTNELVQSRRRTKRAEAAAQALREQLDTNYSEQAAAEYMAATNKLAVEEYFIQGVNAQENGSSDAAIESFQLAAALDSNDAAAYNNIGLSYAAKNDYENAIFYYHKAIAIDSNDIYVLNNLGNALIAQRRYDAAIACYYKVLAIDSAYIFAWNNLGNAYDEQKQSDNAIRCYEKCIAIAPDFAGAYGNMGIVYAREQKYVQAIKYYRKALELDPAFAECANNLGYTYYILNEYDEAIACIQNAISVAENNDHLRESYRTMALIYGAKGNSAEQIKFYKQAAKLGDVSAQAALRRKGQRW